MVRRTLAALAFLLCTLGVAGAQAQASFACAVTENGSPASGTFVVLQNGSEVARGACGAPAPLPAGPASVTVKLDGALDAPEQSRNLTLAAGRTERLAVDFATGRVAISATSQGRRAAARVTILKDGREIGSVASGVDTRLTAGAYEVVVRYRDQEQRYPVRVTAGQRAEVAAAFQ